MLRKGCIIATTSGMREWSADQRRMAIYRPLPPPTKGFAERARQAGSDPHTVAHLQRLECVARLLPRPPMAFKVDAWRMAFTRAGYDPVALAYILRALGGGGATIDLNTEAVLGDAVHQPNRAAIYAYPELVANMAKKELASGAAALWPNDGTLPHVIAPLSVVFKFATHEEERKYFELLRRHGHQLKAIANADFMRTVRAKPFPCDPLDPGIRWPTPLKCRFIHDLREGLNNRGGKTPFDQLTLAHYVTNIRKGWWLWSRDLEGAFKQIAVCELEPIIAGWATMGMIGVATRLPFGATASPFQYGAHLGRPILWLVIRRCADNGIIGFIFVYVDDYLGAHPTEAGARAQTKTFEETCTELGVAWSPGKDQFGQRIKALGLYVSTVPEVTITVPLEKLAKIRLVLQHARNIGFITRGELESTLGMINHVKVGVQNAAPFAADLWDLLVTMPADEPWRPVRIPQFVHDALVFWSDYTMSWNGVVVRDKQVTMPSGHIRSDAAGDAQHAKGKGAVAVLGAVWWFDCEEQHGIAEREMLAAITADICAAALCPNTGVNAALCAAETEADNQVVLRWLEKGRAKGHPVLNRALRTRGQVLAQADMSVAKTYVRSEENDLADAGSHGDPLAYRHAFDRYVLTLPRDRPGWWPDRCRYPPRPHFTFAGGQSTIGALVASLGSDNGEGLPVGHDQVADLLQRVQDALLQLLGD